MIECVRLTIPWFRLWSPQWVTMKSNIQISRRRSERGPVAVVAIIDHQHRALRFPRRLPLRDQGSQTRQTTSRLVIIQREGSVVRLRAHADEVGVDVIGVQNREGLLPVRRRGWFSSEENEGTG